MSDRHSFGRILDLIMVLRPVVLIPVWGFSALGFQRAIRKETLTGITECWDTMVPADYGWMLIFSLAVAAVYIMNQITDVEVDRKNSGMPLIAGGIVSIPSAIVLTILFILLSLILPILHQHYFLVLATVSALIIGFFYCFKPFRFSGRPFLDFISNAFGYGVIAFGAGWITAGKTPFCGSFVINALPYFLLMCGGSISSTLPDIDGDRIDCKNTTAVFLGIMHAHLLAMVFIIGAGIAGILLHDPVAALSAIASLPFYLCFWIRRSRIFMEATYKIGGTFCMIAAFAALPLFIPIAIVVFISTWLYFRIRHGIAYPSLIPVSIEK